MYYLGNYLIARVKVRGKEKQRERNLPFTSSLLKKLQQTVQSLLEIRAINSTQVSYMDDQGHLLKLSQAHHQGAGLEVV